MPLSMAVWAIAGWTVLPVVSNPAHAAAETHMMDPADRSQLMFEIMIAELAGRRGYLDIASEGYGAAAKRTTDPRVSERATKLAVFGRDWAQAQTAALRWRELSPSNPEVYQLLSQIYLRQGNASGAAEQLHALIEISQDPLETSIHSIYTTLIREPDSTTALQAMALLRDKYPQEAASHLGLSRLSLGAGNREEALQAANLAVSLDPQNGEALLVRAQVLMSLGKGVQGLDQLEEAVQRSPDDINLHLGYARLLVDAGRYDTASEQLETIFEKAPDDAQAIFTIGLLGLESKRNAAAERYFTQLLSLGEYQSEAHYYLARIADSQQEYPVAIEHYEAVVAGESFIDAKIRAAELYGLTGQVDAGRERLAELSRQNPDPVLQPRLIRAEARILREADRVADALDVLSKGLEKFPEDGDLLYTRALMAESQGDKAMFEGDLRVLISNEPENAHALNALGYYYVDKNIKLKEAEVLLVKANQLLPSDPAIMDSLGWLYYRQGNLADALVSLRQAYEQYADSEIAAHLGEVLWMSGEKDSAREIWNKAMAESPDDAKLKSVVERFIQ